MGTLNSKPSADGPSLRALTTWNCHISIHAKPTRFKLFLMNLTDNAYYFSSKCNTSDNTIVTSFSNWYLAAKRGNQLLSLGYGKSPSSCFTDCQIASLKKENLPDQPS
jgi:hypothetical protein